MITGRIEELLGILVDRVMMDEEINKEEMLISIKELDEAIQARDEEIKRTLVQAFQIVEGSL